MAKDPNAPSLVRRPEIPWTPYDRLKLSDLLKNYEWDALWEQMNERRRKVKIEKQMMLRKTGQTEEEYILMVDDLRKDMVELFIGGKETWEHFWEDKVKKLSIEKKLNIGFYDFRHLDFFHEINLNLAIFNKEAYFTETIFNEDVNFKQVTFDKGGGFSLAIFNKGASFAGATFNSETTFWEAKFNREADFLRSKFNKTASFTKVTFVQWAIFKQATLQSSGFFHEAKFSGNQIDFSEMILSPDSNLIFAEASFENAVPDFRYLNRSPDMRFHNFNVVKPSLLLTQKKIEKKERKFLKIKDSLSYGINKFIVDKKREWQDENEDRYRKLKELAIGNDNHEYELQFYGYEMNSKLKNFYEGKENPNKKWWKFFNKKIWKFCSKKIWRFFNKKCWRTFSAKWLTDIVPTYFYKYTSNYGQSMLRPLFWLLILWLLPFICYYIADDGLSWTAFVSLWFALTSLSPSSIFETIKPIAPVPFFIYKINSLGYFVTKIIASVFWFFLFLGLRNKFKIK